MNYFHLFQRANCRTRGKLNSKGKRDSEFEVQSKWRISERINSLALYRRKECNGKYCLSQTTKFRWSVVRNVFQKIELILFLINLFQVVNFLIICTRMFTISIKKCIKTVLTHSMTKKLILEHRKSLGTTKSGIL